MFGPGSVGIVRDVSAHIIGVKVLVGNKGNSEISQISSLFFTVARDIGPPPMGRLFIEGQE